MKLPRKKKCKSCGEVFQPERYLQPCCSISCAIALARAQKEKNIKKKRVEFKRVFLANDKPHQKKLAQKAFNRFIRLRDKNEPCISCQRHHNGRYHAGHFRTTGAAPQLRFNELNTNKQCSVCNLHLSGNLIAYRANLINKIGVEKVEWLESEHDVKKYTLDELISIKKKYLKKCREMDC